MQLVNLPSWRHPLRAIIQCEGMNERNHEVLWAGKNVDGHPNGF